MDHSPLITFEMLSTIDGDWYWFASRRVEDGEVRPGNTPRETFENMVQEGKLELA